MFKEPVGQEIMETKRPTFLPLLGERAGVRAGIFLLLISLPVLSAPQIAWLARYNKGVTNGTHQPVAVKFIRLNGSSTNAVASWTSVTNWSVAWTLTNGANPISVQGYDRKTNSLSGGSDSITVTYQP